MTIPYTPLSDARIAELTKLAEADGARIHVLRRVHVQQDRDWQEAINLASPNTPMEYHVRKSEVSAQYQPVSNNTVEKDIVLLEYPKGDGSWNKAIAWGQGASLKPNNPREVFAIGGQFPTLNNTLGQNPMYVVAPIECSFGVGPNACGVWWDDSGRWVCLGWISNFVFAYVWFAFSEDEEPSSADQPKRGGTSDGGDTTTDPDEPDEQAG